MSAKIKQIQGVNANSVLFLDSTFKIAESADFTFDTATSTLNLTGIFSFVDGNQAAGKVLTSDANGVGTWQTAGTGGGIAKASLTFTPGTAGVANTLTHSLGTIDIMVQLWDVATGQVIYADISNATTTQVDITFSANPTGDVKAIVLG